MQISDLTDNWKINLERIGYVLELPGESVVEYVTPGELDISLSVVEGPM
jgi:hypothetical protein